MATRWNRLGGPSVSRRGHGGDLGAVARGLTALFVFVSVLVTGLGVSPASAAPVYEITGRWAPDTPAEVNPGEVVTAEWRVNVNDDAQAPSNDPVDNVTVTLTTTNGQFASIPDLCLTDGVDPASSISDDGTTLVCNLGTQNMGTAIAIQVPVIADGETGDELGLSGEIEGQTADVDPIPIVAEFGMDITWESPTNTTRWVNDDTAVQIDFQWTLNLLKGSEAGPDSVSYTLNLDPSIGGAASALGCEPFTLDTPSGHPWSGGAHPAEQTAPFVDTCTLTPTGTPNEFTLTLTGIDYSLAQVPTKDSGGNNLPVDRNAVASGQVVFRLPAASSGSLGLTSSTPTYTSASGTQTAVDDGTNNAVSKTFTLPGGWASTYGRYYSGQGGTNWDFTYQASPGTQLQPHSNNRLHLNSGNAGQIIQSCTVLDTAYVEASVGRNGTFAAQTHPGAVEVINDPAITVWYYVGDHPSVTPGSGSYDPEVFAANCDVDAGNWTTTQPEDVSTIKAARLVYNADDAQQYDPVFLVTHHTIKEDVPVGQDIWQFSSFKVGDNPWNYNTSAAAAITPTPGTRFPYTTAWRDVVRVVGMQPYVEKSVDRSSVRVGDPAVYTIGYAANGGAAAPPTVDDFVLTDTLPVGMTYVAGSASPEPVVTTNADGEQVLTWTLDGVPTNQLHALTYQAVANDDAEPGQTLTNTVVGSVAGMDSAPATTGVVLLENGSTEIGKTADQAFIPNVDGDGVGEGSWTVTLRSFDPAPQTFTDTIDILPYNGDGRGTSYTGSYELTGVTAVPGATVYYTDADPATLTDDPADPSNGAAGDPAGNTVGWSTAMPADVTAVRVVGPELAPGATQAFTVAVATDGVVGGDVLVNRAQARAEHTELVMRTSAPITVANYYSASLKKYLQDRNGEWRDADDVTDYPAFQYGDTVHYRIVVTNTGQGTLTNIDVTDDQQPTSGNFTIASLAPGESESHEFSIVLDESADGTVVNTASATADTPPDSNVPPTIPPDPAGFEVANYTTEKISDPAEGSTVKPGDTVTYTVTVTQQGSAPADAVFSDDLADVLDDATYNGDVEASLGDVEFEDGHIVWSGTIPVDGVATITYSVTVEDKADRDFDLANVVTSPGCTLIDGRTPDCTTEHPVGQYEFSKTSDPAPGSSVDVGETIRYSVRVNQVGQGPVEDAEITDDLSKLLDDADYNGDAASTSGAVEVAGDTLRWTGDLTVGQTVNITYSVTVIEAGNDKLVNVVTGAPGGACVPAPDQNPDCTTTHDKNRSTTSGEETGGRDGWLPNTGAPFSLAMLVGALGLVILGTATLLTAAHRPRKAAPDPGLCR